MISSLLPGTHYARVSPFQVKVFEPCHRCGGTLGEPVRMALTYDQTSRLKRADEVPGVCECGKPDRND